MNIFRDFLTQNLNLSFSTRASRHDSGIQSPRAVMFTRMRTQIAKFKQTAGPVYKVCNFHQLASFCKAENSPTTCSKWLFNALFDVWYLRLIICSFSVVLKVQEVPRSVSFFHEKYIFCERLLCNLYFRNILTDSYINYITNSLLGPRETRIDTISTSVIRTPPRTDTRL